MQRDGDRDDSLIDDGARRVSLWSHDVLLAVAVTLLAISFISIAATGSGSRQDASIGVTTAISRK